MIRTTNSKCRQYVESLQEFKANNLEGKYVGNYYVVFSYGWYPLFVRDRTSGLWYENSERKSVSTSKQLGQCRPFVNTGVVSKVVRIEKTTAELKAMYEVQQ